MGVPRTASCAVAIAAVAMRLLLPITKEEMAGGIPDHLLGNAAVFDDRLLDPQTAKNLVETIKSVGRPERLWVRFDVP